MELGFTFVNKIKIFVPANKENKWPLSKGNNLEIPYKKKKSKKEKIKVIKIPKIQTDKIKCKRCGSKIQRRIKAQHMRSFKCLNYNNNI